MNIYLLTQNDQNGYETYDSCVVIAENDDDARRIHPIGSDWYVWLEDAESWGFVYADGRIEPESISNWTNDINKIIVHNIGISHIDEPGVVCASFNAG